ncbi:MAG: nuclear transport factor 2 family protein [Caldimonas sp.]
MTPLAVFRKSYRAYVDKDLAAIESILADDFHFTSPIDNRLDRKTYLRICWPNSQGLERFDEVFACEAGDRACIAYEATAKGGKRFRNCEIATVRDGKLVAVEVYFGWNVPHKLADGSHADNDGAEHP